jgi:hypothetical protein
MPFIVKAWSRDRPVAILSPALLFIRALALGLGFASGLAFNLGAGEQLDNRRSL